MRIEKVDSIIPINGKQLAKRWGIEPIDIFFIMLNHDLGALGYFGNRAEADVIIGATLGSEDKDLDPGNWRFSIIDVKELEINELEEALKNRQKLIRGKSLLKQWDFDKDDLFMSIINGDLSIVDPFGHPIDINPVFELLEEEILNVSDLLFSKSEIEEFERDYSHLLSERTEIIANEEIYSNVETEETDAPKLSFFRTKKIWSIGEFGKEAHLTNLKGYEIIRFLIQNEGKEIDVLEIKGSGDEADDLADALPGHKPAGLKLTVKEALSDGIDSDGNPESYDVNPQSIRDFSNQPIVDSYAIEDYKNARALLKEQIQSETDPEKILEMKEDLERIDEILKKDVFFNKKAQNFKSQRRKNCQSNIRKRIKTALETLERDAPYLIDFLNESTITTGYTCKYQPDPDNKPKWILDPPQ